MAASSKPVPPKPKKPGFWSKLGQSIGEALGQASADRSK